MQHDRRLDRGARLAKDAERHGEGHDQQDAVVVGVPVHRREGQSGEGEAGAETEPFPEAGVQPAAEEQLLGERGQHHDVAYEAGEEQQVGRAVRGDALGLQPQQGEGQRSRVEQGAEADADDLAPTQSRLRQGDETAPIAAADDSRRAQCRRAEPDVEQADLAGADLQPHHGIEARLHHQVG